MNANEKTSFCTVFVLIIRTRSAIHGAAREPIRANVELRPIILFRTEVGYISADHRYIIQNPIVIPNLPTMFSAIKYVVFSSFGISETDKQEKNNSDGIEDVCLAYNKIKFA